MLISEDQTVVTLDCGSKLFAVEDLYPNDEEKIRCYWCGLDSICPSQTNGGEAAPCSAEYRKDGRDVLYVKLI